jgi:gas vesicle protein
MDNSRAVAVSIVGAVVGAVAAYLFFTEHGRQVRRRLEPAIDDLARELSSFRATVEKAASVAGDGWKALNDAMADGNPLSTNARYSAPRQTSPF